MASVVYVLDTSIILAEGIKSLYSFGRDDVVIPRIVIRELQSKRHDPILGETSRSVLRTILKIMKDGQITEGISLGAGYGTLRIELNHVETSGLNPAVLKDNTNDVRILAVAKSLDAVLVTRDVELQILANIEGVMYSDMSEEADSSIESHIKGIKTYDVSPEEINAIYSKGEVRLDLDVPRNTGVILKDYNGNSALAISKSQWIFELANEVEVGKIKGRSAEQKILFHHLNDEEVGVVSVSGPAGSGKSFAMLATALELVEDPSTPYKKIVVFRPVNPVGGQHQDLGFLPGTMDEKLAPHAQAVWDTMGTIRSSTDVERLKKSGKIEFASIAHVRGRTLANCIVILDELQNVEQSTIITLLSRLGVNSRVFVGWDIAQRDAQYIGKYDGIYKVVRRLYGHKLFAHITLRKSERSAISEMVAGLLEE